nr:MAG TPA: Transcription initiation factor TFIID 23-30kDa subunit [Caudoviricetes sp.]
MSLATQLFIADIANVFIPDHIISRLLFKLLFDFNCNS